MRDGFYEEGKRAFEEGKSVDDNPYIYDDNPDSGYMHWLNGYLDAKRKYLKWKWLFDLFKFYYA